MNHSKLRLLRPFQGTSGVWRKHYIQNGVRKLKLIIVLIVSLTTATARVKQMNLQTKTLHNNKWKLSKSYCKK